MIWLLLLPFAIQSFLMGLDEFHFHWRRGLPRWERIGHPLDTMTVLACYAWVVLVAPSSQDAVAVYVMLAVVSVAFIAKDEFVHARECQPAEHLIHALLFGFHGSVLLAAGLIWPAFHPPGIVTSGFAFGIPGEARYALVALVVHMAATTAFLLYQIVYWNLIWKPDSRDEA